MTTYDILKNGARHLPRKEFKILEHKPITHDDIKKHWEAQKKKMKKVSRLVW